MANLSLDISYLRTPSGLIKCILAVRLKLHRLVGLLTYIFVVSFQVLNLAGAISSFVSVCTFISRLNFFEFVAIAGLVWGLTVILLRLAKIEERFALWMIVEFCLTCLWILFSFIGACLIAATAAQLSCGAGPGFAAFFGFATFFLYCADGFIIFRSGIQGRVQVDGTRGEGQVGTGAAPAQVWTTQEPPPKY